MAWPHKVICIAASVLLFGMSVLGEAALAAPQPLEAYGNLPKTEALELSPSGTLFARISTQGETRLLTVEKVSGGVVMTARAGDVKTAGLEWANDDYLIVYMHRTTQLDVSDYAQEFLQGVLVDVKKGELRPLLPVSDSYMSAIFGRYGFAEVDGTTYGYFGVVPLDPRRETAGGGGMFKQNYPDLYRVDLKTGGLHRIAEGANNRQWVLDEHGEIIATSDYDNHSGTWNVYRPTSLRPVLSGHADYWSGIFGRGRIPGTVLLAAHDSENTVREVKLDDASRADLSAESFDGEIYAPTSHLLAGIRLAGEYPKTVAFDPVLARHMGAIEHAFGGDQVTLESLSADLSKIVVFVVGKSTPGTWQLVDFTTGKAQPLADAWPDIPNAMMGEVRVIDYRAGDGLAMKGILTLPLGQPSGNLPLVVLPHGGPESMDRADFDWWTQAFAARGYAVFQPNFRGSSGHGSEFRNAGFGQWGRRMQTDISDGMAALAQQGIIDPKRVCIVGASYGGYAALAGVTLQHGLYRCAAAYAGVSDPGDMLQFAYRKWGEYARPELRYWRSYLLGEGAKTSSVPDDISPLARAAEADAPILLIHGVDDTIVPIDQSKHMEAALSRAGKSVEFVTLKGEDHWLSRSETRLQMLKAMVGFVEKYNPAEAATH
jgi:dipeptidyl aminopeptidase/acylaminoacyl peptidase